MRYLSYLFFVVVAFFTVFISFCQMTDESSGVEKEETDSKTGGELEWIGLDSTELQELKRRLGRSGKKNGKLDGAWSLELCYLQQRCDEENCSTACIRVV
ncbi:hypothetical protein ACQKWADRAFT_296149 [Trichoderma austrokoningii]